MENKFLDTYGKESFQDMRKNEYRSQFTSLLSRQSQITRHLRASVIDWIFEVGGKLGINDKFVLYLTISLIDRFYEAQEEDFSTKDLQLTAVTSLFIASKSIDVEPIDLQTCCKTLCFSKYSKSQFLNKETAIR